MEWMAPDAQRKLWSAFVRYAQTHRDVVTSIPNQAYVILIPEIDLILDHEFLRDLLLWAPVTAGSPIAYIHLALSAYYVPCGEGSLPTITDARVEVLGSLRTPALS